MSRYITIDPPDPLRWFASLLKHARPGLEHAYLAAWEANEKYCQLMKEELFADYKAQGPAFPFSVFLDGGLGDDDGTTFTGLIERRDELHLAARANDLALVNNQTC